MKSIIARIGEFVKRHTDTFWRFFVLALISWSAYNLGLIHAKNGGIPAQNAALLQIRTSTVSQKPAPQGQGSADAVATPSRTDTRVVVSKTSSSKKYHYSWCGSGQRIKEANRLWFPTAQAAQTAGYSLAGNCTE